MILAMRRARLAAITLAAAATATLLAIAIASPAEAAKPRFATTISIGVDFQPSKPNPLRFYGRVGSPKPACRGARRVILDARYPGMGRVRMGTTLSKPKGGWVIRLPGDGAARYVVTVKPKPMRRHVCRGTQARFAIVN